MDNFIQSDLGYKEIERKNDIWPRIEQRHQGRCKHPQVISTCSHILTEENSLKANCFQIKFNCELKDTYESVDQMGKLCVPELLFWIYVAHGMSMLKHLTNIHIYKTQRENTVSCQTKQNYPKNKIVYRNIQYMVKLTATISPRILDKQIYMTEKILSVHGIITNYI